MLMHTCILLHSYGKTGYLYNRY